MKNSHVPASRRPLAAFRPLCLVVTVALIALLGWRGVYVVDEAQIAVVRDWGHTCKQPVARAGLCVKWPWQSAHHVDRRVRVLSFEAREKLTQDHESVVVRPCVFWRVPIDAAESFLRSVGHDAAAEPLLADIVWRVLDRELSQRPLTDWLNPIGDREPAGDPPQLAILARVTAVCRSEAYSRWGIDVLDVQMQQFSRPERLTDDLLRLMEADYARQIGRDCLAVDLRRDGLLADARREADRILSEAEEKAARIRADGRREALRLEGEARGLNGNLTDYLYQLDGYRTMAANNGVLESPAAMPGKSGADQASGPNKKPAPTGQAPTPDTAPAPRSGNKAVSRPG